MSGLSTHILDAALGKPAVGVRVMLTNSDGTVLASSVTDSDGRIAELFTSLPATGTYRLVFDTEAYFAATGTPTFYPEVTISFSVSDPAAHYHVPLLLSPFAYSTYRGS